MKLLLVLATLWTLGCSDGAPTGPPPQTIVGHWVSQRFSLGESASYEHHLTFTSGRFASEARDYGSYPGQAPEEFSGYNRVEGTYSVDGDRLRFHPQRLVWWDLFYGKDSPVQVIQPYPYGAVFDGARFEMVGDSLTLRYISYPADAPLETVLGLTRAIDLSQTF